MILLYYLSNTTLLPVSVSSCLFPSAPSPSLALIPVTQPCPRFLALGYLTSLLSGSAHPHATLQIPSPCSCVVSPSSHKFPGARSYPWLPHHTTLRQNTTLATKLITMSENVIIPTNNEPETFAIVKIMATRARGLEALATASADNLDPATLCTRYNNTIQLARALNASENLTEQFATLLSDTKTLTNE
jgi:hypothetical protein